MEQKDIFLCHSSVDKSWVEDLGADIEDEEWNGRRLSVFLDKWDIDGGDNIILRLNQGLERSRLVAIVMSPEMLTSEWCKAEWSSVVHTDPTNRAGRILPIRLRDFHARDGSRLQVPPFLQSLAYYDFRAKKDYAREFKRMLAKIRGEAPPRGRARKRYGSRTQVDRVVPVLPSAREEPDTVDETLISNLLPVRAFPTTIWSAHTKLQTKRDLPADLPPAIIREGRLFSFVDLGDVKNPFRNFVDVSGVQRVATVDWRPDPARWRWFIELLNDTLVAHLKAYGIHFDDFHRRYYFAADGPATRYVRWGSGTKRWVVRVPPPEKNGSWIHHAARLRFETLGSKLYLSIDPTLIFTTDGKTPVPREVAGPLAMQWTGRERNGAILRSILMWCDALAWGKREAVINAGEQRLVIARLPNSVRTSAGLAHDHVEVGALLNFTVAEIDPNSTSLGGFGYVDDEEPEDVGT